MENNLSQNEPVARNQAPTTTVSNNIQPNYPETTVEQNTYKDFYYSNNKRKVGDLLLGFFGMLGASILYSIVFGLIAPITAKIFSNEMMGMFAGFTNLFITLTLTAIVCYKLIKADRKYIAIGIIAFCLLPFLLLGGCLMLLAGAGGWN